MHFDGERAIRRGTSVRSRRADEQETYQSLTRFLDRQGELDSTDKSDLRRFLESHSGSLEMDWSAVEDDLDRQGEPQLLEQLVSRRYSSEEDIIAIASSLHNKLSSNASWTLLVGAGGSSPSPTEIPTVSELLPILWKKAAEINAPSLLRLEDVCNRLGITDIEVLLTAIELAQMATHSPGAVGLLEALLFQRSSLDGVQSRGTSRRISAGRTSPENVEILSESSQTLFSVLVGMMTEKPSNAIHKAIADRIASGQGDTVITTNYDVCIEKALMDQGRAYRYGFVDEDQSGSLVLKLHGSLNWYSCRSCDEHVTADLRQISDAVESGLYPIVSMCRSCSATAQQMIVPPTAMKSVQHPVLLEIRQQAEQALRASGMIVVIGYSFTESDQYVKRMIARAMRDDPSKPILVFDSAIGPIKRLRNYLLTHSSDVGESSVYSILGDGSVSVDMFVRQWKKISEASPVEVQSA